MTIPEEPMKRPPVAQKLLPPLVPPTPVYVPSHRPVSVIIIAVLFFIGVAVEIIGLFWHEYSDMLTQAERVANVLFAVIYLVVGICLLKWLPAARVAAIITLIARFAISLPMVFLELAFHPRNLPMSQDLFIGTIEIEIAFAVLMGIYFALLIYYLTRPAVKAAFV